MSYLDVLVAYALLTVFLLQMDIFYTYAHYGFAFGFSSNRNPSKPRGRFGLRIQRTLQNQIESSAYAVPVLVAAALTGLQSPLAQAAAGVFLASRLAFAALYYLGVPFVRALAFAAGVASILVIAYALFAAGAVFALAP